VHLLVIETVVFSYFSHLALIVGLCDVSFE
jgi:hypothetical protein